MFSILKNMLINFIIILLFDNEFHLKSNQIYTTGNSIRDMILFLYFSLKLHIYLRLFSLSLHQEFINLKDSKLLIQLQI